MPQTRFQFGPITRLVLGIWIVLSFFLLGCSGGDQPNTLILPDTVVVSMEVQPGNGIMANGVDQGTLQFRVESKEGTPISGLLITVFHDAQDLEPSIVQPSIGTDAQGIAFAKISSKKAGLIPLRLELKAGTKRVEVQNVGIVEFLSSGDLAVASPNLSTITVAPETGVLANGNSEAKISVLVRDPSGIPLSNREVLLTSTGSGNEIIQPGRTDSTGLAVGSIRSRIGGKKILTLRINPDRYGDTILEAKPEIHFVELADLISPDPYESTVQVTPDSLIPATGVAKARIEVVVRKSDSSVVPNQFVSIEVSGSGNILSQDSGLTNAEGKVVAYLASTKVETKKIYVHVNHGTAVETKLTDEPSVSFAQTLGEFGSVTKQSISSGSRQMAYADFNEDGVADLAIAHTNSTNDRVSVWLGSQTGTFTEMPAIRVANGGGFFGLYYAITAADFNGDSVLDLAFSSNESSRTYIALGNEVIVNSVPTGKGDGTFKTPFLVDTCYGVHALATGDINGDGLVDLAAGCRSGSVAAEISYTLNLGNGVFGQRVDLQADSYVSDIAIADLDRNGLGDIITLHRNEDVFSVHLSKKEEQSLVVESGIEYRTPYSPNRLIIADLDRNGKSDILISSVGDPNRNAYQISIFIGQDVWSRTSVPNRVDIPVIYHPHSLRVADITRDGILDIVYTSEISHTLSLLPGHTEVPFAFEAEAMTPVGKGPKDLALIDFNADGLVDAVTLDSTDGTLSKVEAR